MFGMPTDEDWGSSNDDSCKRSVVAGREPGIVVVGDEEDDGFEDVQRGVAGGGGAVVHPPPRRPRTTGLGVYQSFRRAFSIEQEYEMTALGDSYDDDDASSFDEDHEDGFVIHAHGRWRGGRGRGGSMDVAMGRGGGGGGGVDGFPQWRMLGMGILVVLAVATIAIAFERRHKDGNGGTSHGFFGSRDDDDDGGNGGGPCDDPLWKLRSSAFAGGYPHAAVATDHPTCSTVGASVLRDQNGNAVDAAIAVALCLGVANPSSSGLGGGAFILVHADPTRNNRTMPAFDDRRTDAPWSSTTNATTIATTNATNATRLPASASGKITEVIDCREVAPGGATTRMYDGLPSDASLVGGLSVPVPGELRGLELAHARYGSLPWPELVRPARDLARNGVVVNGNLASEIAIAAERLSSSNFNPNATLGLRKRLTRNDDWNFPLMEGDLLTNPELGDLLDDVMEYGAEAMYRSPRAEALAREIRDAGGIVTAEDFHGYRATLRSAVFAHDVNGFSVCGVPPPSSGGAVVVGALRFLAGYRTPLASFADALSVHRLVEASKHAFSMRLSLSDPAYDDDRHAADDAVRDLTRGGYMERLRRITRDDGTLPLSQYGGEKWSQVNDTDGREEGKDGDEGDRRGRGRGRRRRRKLANPFGYLEDEGTSHFSIVDGDGNAVAMTTSINSRFGSGVVSPSTGITFSNTMNDFGIPGTGANYFGIKPSEANFIEPGKRPLSSMSPTLVFRTTSDDVEKNRDDGGGDRTPVLGDLVLAVGASGGPKIISSVLQTIVNAVMLGRPLFESIMNPRVHNQLVYNGAAVTLTESSTLRQGRGPSIAVSDRTRRALTDRGQRLVDVTYMGAVQAVAVDPETQRRSAGCDLRKGGAPDGY